MEDHKEYKILFVDDEKSILNTLKRSFLGKPLKILTASSPSKGFEILKKEKIDVVISDIKMPVMNGIEFLKIVKEKYPEINRIILSGYVEKESVVNAIISGISFSYLTKPWSEEELFSKIMHVIKIKDIIKNKNILNIVNKIEKLPDIPELYENFLHAVYKNDSMSKIAEIISTDLSLATKLLQIVNSAFYSLKKISSLKVAVNLLGLNNLKTIIFSTILLDERNLSNKEKKELIKISQFSFKVNKLFSKIYETKYKESLSEAYSSLGIVYNIGKIIMLKDFSNEYFKILDKMKKDNSIDFYEKEVEVGLKDCTHREIGAYFLDLWNFSEINISAALYHFDTKNLSEEERKVIYILKFSDNLLKYYENNLLNEFYKTELYIKSDFSKETLIQILESLGDYDE